MYYLLSLSRYLSFFLVTCRAIWRDIWILPNVEIFPSHSTHCLINEFTFLGSLEIPGSLCLSIQYKVSSWSYTTFPHELEIYPEVDRWKPWTISGPKWWWKERQNGNRTCVQQLLWTLIINRELWADGIEIIIQRANIIWKGIWFT